MTDNLDHLIGTWVHVQLIGTFAWYGTSANSYNGILDDADEGNIYLRVPNGETLFLPRNQVVSVVCIQPPPGGPEGTLLRPSDAPPENTDALLRPATYTPESTPERRLRPSIRPRGHRQDGE